MANLYLIPTWFFGYDAIFEFFIVLLALIVGIFAFKVYRLSGEKQLKFFGLAFLFISASYFIQALANLIIYGKLSKVITNILNINDFVAISYIGSYSHIFLLTVGLLTLTYMTLKVESIKIYTLLSSIILVSLILSPDRLYLFYIISSILLFYIVIFYLMNYIKNKKITTMLIFIAFIFSFLGSINFIFSMDYNLHYMLGHFFKFTAYTLILISLILITKKDET